MGPAYLAGQLLNAGHEVEQYYCPYSDNKEELLANIADAIRSSLPDVISFSITSDNFWMLKISAEYIKENYRLPIIVGGPHAIIDPQSILGLDGVSAVCVGEGELPLVKFANAVADGKPFHHVEGWWFREGKASYPGVLHDIDRLCHPDRDGYMEKYSGQFRNGWVFQSNRGCPYRCTFCSETFFRTKFKGKKYLRSRCIDGLIEEIRLTTEKYSAKMSKFVGFSNPTFNIDGRWLIDFCEKYARHIGYPFGCDLELSNVSKETIAALTQANCRTAWIGFESGNDFVRKEILRKNLTTREAMAKIELLRSARIEVELYAIIGLPFETGPMIEDTYNALKSISADAILPSIFIPFPGTELGELCYERGWAERICKETARPISGYYRSILEYPHITQAKIQHYYDKIREINQNG